MFDCDTGEYADVHLFRYVRNTTDPGTEMQGAMGAARRMVFG